MSGAASPALGLSWAGKQLGLRSGPVDGTRRALGIMQSYLS